MKSLLSIFSGSKSKQESVKSNYVRPKDIQKYATPQPIEDINVSKNGKPTLLFMDDNYGVIELIKEDVYMLSVVLNNIDSERYQNLFNSLSHDEIIFLSGFSPDEYNLIYVTTNTCGIAVERAIENGLVVDAALLDVILGGVSLTPDGVAVIVDGIDIAYALKQVNPKLKHNMYTACTLGEHSPESVKYRELFGHSILDDVVYKNSDLLMRRRSVLSLLMHAKNR